MSYFDFVRIESPEFLYHLSSENFFEFILLVVSRLTRNIFP
jgi:hypothetical protein